MHYGSIFVSVAEVMTNGSVLFSILLPDGKACRDWQTEDS